MIYFVVEYEIENIDNYIVGVIVKVIKVDLSYLVLGLYNFFFNFTVNKV